MTAAKNAPITRWAFRFRRVRLETLDVVLESRPGDLGHALALIQASRIAGLKRTVWQPDNEPYRTFLEASVEETSRPSADPRLSGSCASTVTAEASDLD